jgi:hypothetical protein
MRSLCCLCVCVSPYRLLNAWTNLYETWYVWHGTWAHLNCVLHKSLPLVCVCVCRCIPLSLLGNGSVRALPRQRIHATIEELLDASFSMKSVQYRMYAISSSQKFLLIFYSKSVQRNRNSSSVLLVTLLKTMKIILFLYSSAFSILRSRVTYATDNDPRFKTS